MLAEYILVGWILIVGAAETAHLCAVFLRCPLSVCVGIFWGLTAVLCILLLLCIRGSGKRRIPARDKKVREQARTRRKLMGSSAAAGIYILYGIFGLLVLVQLATAAGGETLYLTGDMTAEQVNSFLTAGQVHTLNPLTGQAYQLGMPLRLKILCLPSFYAILCKSFSIPAARMVWQMVPAAVVILSYLAFWCAAKALFPGEREKEGLKRGGFMVLAAVLIQAGSYAYGMDGFGLLYSGFRGVTIRSCVLLPFVFAALLRRKRLWIALCIAAEACMVWTLYGLGACAAVTAVWYLLAWMEKRISGKRRERRRIGEDDTCRSF